MSSLTATDFRPQDIPRPTIASLTRQINSLNVKILAEHEKLNNIYQLIDNLRSTIPTLLSPQLEEAQADLHEALAIAQRKVTWIETLTNKEYMRVHKRSQLLSIPTPPTILSLLN